METKDRAARLAVLTALRDAIDAAIENDREDLTLNLKELSSMFGVKSIEIELPNGNKVATASLSVSEPKPYVNNEREFLDWVSTNHPDEIVRQVRPSFQRALFDKLEPAGEEAIHIRTGEVVAGLFFSEGGKEKLTVRFKSNGRQLVADAFSQGELEAVMKSLYSAEITKETKVVEYSPNENLGDSPTNDQAIKSQPAGALGS